MPSPINKKLLKHLAALARIELTAKEEEKLLKDLQKIVDYFKELQNLDTQAVEPASGGTMLEDVLRPDEDERVGFPRVGSETFPEEESGFLKVPPVFE
jgi:aspartyl-tRNA(Asn)/glutamyl-tRNA(Gln) amidotransferase subunit C